MNPQSGNNGDRDYLWDPAAPPDDAVAETERLLEPLQFIHRQKPLVLPARPARKKNLTRTMLAIAASLAVVGIAATMMWWWRESWPAGRAWPVSVGAAASRQAVAALALDRPLVVNAPATEIAIARIGAMLVEPGSAITLTETTSARHRITLDRGSISVRVWAPPARFAIRTPAGNVIDLGCVFDLNVDAAGLTQLKVLTGWVQLENGWGETLVPAGTSATMLAARRPSVPVYDDAAPLFKARVPEFERAVDDATRLGILPEIAVSARRRDVLTLLMLANQSTGAVKRALLERAAELRPPPADVTIEQILADRSRLWIWYDALDLPPAKSWWLNWRDALPRPRR
jgi:hypothetical protein